MPGADVRGGAAAPQLPYGGGDDEVLDVPHGEHVRRGGVPGGGHGPLGGVQQRLRLREEGRPRRGERAALGGAVEQPYPEGVLQPFDLTAQGGLGDVQRLGRTGEVQMLGDDREVPHQPEIEIRYGTGGRERDGVVGHVPSVTAPDRHTDGA